VFLRGEINKCAVNGYKTGLPWSNGQQQTGEQRAGNRQRPEIRTRRRFVGPKSNCYTETEQRM
jgi:hypothetical protein